MQNKLVKIILKILLTLGISFIIVFSGFIILILCLSQEITGILTLLSVLLIPSLLFPLLYAKNKKRVLKYWLIYVLTLTISLSINIMINKYNEKITIDTNPNINTNEYLPFDSNSKIVKLE